MSRKIKYSYELKLSCVKAFIDKIDAKYRVSTDIADAYHFSPPHTLLPLHSMQQVSLDLLQK
ncbi:MAG: hypothetical protein RLZZ474_382, partial [Bacteroidota bacterium]